MFLTYAMLLVALCLSAVAAFYSIIGLTAIFAAAVVPIIIMGSILEIAKVTVTIWLHEYWSQCKRTMKLYLVPAVFTLMVLTSMGIFGFLSKAHLDQTVPAGDIVAQVGLFDEKIKNERDTISNARTLLAQLDRAVNDISSGPDKEIKLRNGETQVQTAAERALQVRRQQARDRAALIKTIEEAQARIVKLQEERAPIASEARKVEAEVGPIKYVAALIYGDQTDVTMLERAVRWVIILIVAVFDPLAIMMLLAATESMKWERERRAQISKESSPGDAPPEEARPEPPVPESAQPEPGSELNRANIKFIDDFHEPDWPEPAQPTVAVDTERPGDYVEHPTSEVITHDDDDDDDEDPEDRYKEAKRIWKEQNPGRTLKEQRRLLAAGRISRLPWENEDDLPVLQSAFGFGNEFPSNPVKGDKFVRTDVMPTRLYKFNGDDWILADKAMTDTYAHDEKYIDFLIERISRGEYDPELLTDSERAEIETRLRSNV